MEQNQSSQSALGVAFFRAIESQKPEASRICYDPYARAFLPTVSYILVKLMVDSGLYERMGPGAVGFITVRERYIDDYLKTGLAEGLDQVVLTGGRLRYARLPHPRNREDPRVRNRLPGDSGSQAEGIEKSHRSIAWARHLRPDGFQYPVAR